jgi:hypothetical protein
MKNTVSDVKNILHEIKGILDIAEENIRELEDL